MNKKTYIEFMRIVACFLVIVNHTNSRIFQNSSPGFTWFCSLTYFFVCKIAVPLFLFIMGALLLQKEDSPQKSLHRLTRIFVVFVIGSFCYYTYYSLRDGTAFSFKEFLLKLPQSRMTKAFWYFHLYLALLCLLPILQKLVKALNQRQLAYLLFLSLGILGTVPLIPAFKLSSYFTAGLIGPYIGQVLLGYYIERYVPLTKKVFCGCFCVFILLITFQVAATYSLYLHNPSSYGMLDNRTLNTITGSAACFYICIKYVFINYPVPSKLEHCICRLGTLTFGIYLLSDMAIAQSIPVYSALQGYMHSLVAMVLWELLIFTACAFIIAGLRLFPPLRKWI